MRPLSYFGMLTESGIRRGRSLWFLPLFRSLQMQGM